MKFKNPIDLSIFNIYSMRDPEDFLRMFKLYREKLPNLIPEKWDWTEPLKRSFDINKLQDIACSSTGRFETFWWNRKNKPKAEGSFSPRWQSRSALAMDTHSTVRLTTELGDVDELKLINYLKIASIEASADIAILDGITENYKAFATQNHSALFSSKSDSGTISFTTHLLRHWLPDIFWATVFGPAYVKLFGMEKLLSVPAYRVEKLGDEMVYIQLSPSVRDLHTNFASVQVVRDKVKAHLGKEAFFDPDKAYDFFKAGPVGNVFKVPNFELKP